MTKKKLYIILSLFLGAILIFRFFALPIIKESQNTKLKLEEKKVQLLEKKEIFKTIDEFKKEYEIQKDKLGIIDSILPADSKIIDILFQFQSIATDAGLVMKSISHGESSTNLVDCKAVSVSLSLVGSYPALKSFLRALESNLRITDVEKISFSPAEAALGEGIFNISLGVRVHYCPVREIPKLPEKTVQPPAQPTGAEEY